MTENTNPGNFANRPKEEVKEAARKGGEHSHGGNAASYTAANDPGRNPDGTFAKGNEAASGGSGNAQSEDGRNADGTFKAGSELTSELGKRGGQQS